MNRIDRINLAITKGYTYNEVSGKVFGVRGKEITRKDTKGYIVINLNGCQLKAHHFAWYVKYNNVPEILDHINGNTLDNRICNLRSVSHQENMFNRKAKGYYFNKINKNYQSYIKLNNRMIHLGSFNTPDEAHKAYLDAKKTYHKING
jgi:hypothetical protein